MYLYAFYISEMYIVKGMSLYIHIQIPTYLKMFFWLTNV